MNRKQSPVFAQLAAAITHATIGEEGCGGSGILGHYIPEIPLKIVVERYYHLK